jgi:hypothetical protein
VPIVSANEAVDNCGCENNCSSGLAGDIKEIQDAEKDKIINMALKNEKFKSLQKELVEQGFTLKEPIVYIVPMKTDDGLIEIPVMVSPFEKDESEGKSILYTYNPNTDSSITLLVEGSVVPMGLVTFLANLALCLGSCLCCTIPCATPISWPLCLGCILVCGGACTLAYCDCAEYCCDLGNQWCCDNQCP